jgi:hypothetical protein
VHMYSGQSNIRQRAQYVYVGACVRLLCGVDSLDLCMGTSPDGSTSDP